MSYHSHRRPRPFKDLTLQNSCIGVGTYRRIKKTVAVNLNINFGTHKYSFHEDRLVGCLEAGSRPGKTLYLLVGTAYGPPGQAGIRVLTNGEIWCSATICNGSFTFKAEN